MAELAPFSAVSTTGIYCRPGCPAQPRRDHVQGFATAAAAEAAGYRACLRCRPYRQSDTAGWVDGPELVCRAVRLIVDGALDDSDENGLAMRLGVSARHLRRLFADHIGASPDQLARSRRAHFARRLLDDTDLTITEIAHATGFGSIRQLNRVMRAVFRAPPGELRRRRRKTDRLVADGGLALRLPFAPPLAWRELLGFLDPRAIPGVEAVDLASATYRRTISVNGDPGVFEVGPGDGHTLHLRVHLPHWEGLIHIVQRVRRLFDLDADPHAISAVLGADELLTPELERVPGLRVPGAWDPLEMAVRAVLGQQVSVAGATTLAARIVEQAGRPVPGLEPWHLTHTFPTAPDLASAELDGLGLPASRAATVRALASAVASGELLLDGRAGLSNLIGALTSVRGVGPWTAHYLAMRLGERDAFPAGDLWLRRAIEPGTTTPAATLERRSETWRPWRSYAAMYLWRRALVTLS